MCEKTRFIQEKEDKALIDEMKFGPPKSLRYG